MRPVFAPDCQRVSDAEHSAAVVPNFPLEVFGVELLSVFSAKRCVHLPLKD